MKRATVVGELWAARKVDALSGHKLLLLAFDAAKDRDRRVVVALDTLDARIGDAVLVSWGSGARNVLRAGPDNKDLLCDAAVSLVVDGDTSVSRSKPESG